METNYKRNVGRPIGWRKTTDRDRETLSLLGFPPGTELSESLREGIVAAYDRLYAEYGVDAKKSELSDVAKKIDELKAEQVETRNRLQELKILQNHEEMKKVALEAQLREVCRQLAPAIHLLNRLPGTASAKI